MTEMAFEPSKAQKPRRVTRTKSSATEPKIRAVARKLNAALGPTMVAAATGTKNRQLPTEWATAGGPRPGVYEERKLRFALEQWNRISDFDGPEVARIWFLGGNPTLGEKTPLTAIREGRYEDVRTAVATYTDPGTLG